MRKETETRALGETFSVTKSQSGFPDSRDPKWGLIGPCSSLRKAIQYAHSVLWVLLKVNLIINSFVGLR
jgi:hypothetical protein